MQFLMEMEIILPPVLIVKSKSPFKKLDIILF